jgi:hypothetical protein
MAAMASVGGAGTHTGGRLQGKALRKNVRGEVA